MKDFTKGLIVGLTVVVAFILFVGATQDSDMGRWEYLDKLGDQAFDTKTGTLAVWVAGTDDQEERVVHINFSTGKRTIITVY